MGFNRKLVTSIIANAQQFEWTLQGLGMFRTYISDEIRIHIWDRRFTTPDVTRLHTHPWDFESEIMWGRLTNVLYDYCMPHQGPKFIKHPIHCGVDLKGSPSVVSMRVVKTESYHHGQTYKQYGFQIHDTIPFVDGTVTVLSRRFTKKDRDSALVFIPTDGKFVSAVARPAKASEVIEMSQTALEQLRFEMGTGATA